MKKEHFILILIVVSGFILRIFNIGSVPPGLNWDEVSHGYNAYSILQTGKDEWGVSFPITNFRAYGDYPLPLYMYLSMPLISVLGLNEFSIRFVSVLFGSLLIVVVYFLSRRITSSNTVSLLAAFLISLSPWDILLSRQVLQAIPAIFFQSLGILLFLKGVNAKKALVVVGIICLGISSYGYHNTRILAPAIILILLVIFSRYFNKEKRSLLSILIISTLFLIPVFSAIFSKEGSARALWVGILDQGAINRINEARGESNLSEPLAKAIYNKGTYFAQTAFFNYFTYFSPTYLGINGGSQYQYSVQGFGIVYPIELPFFYIGVFFLITKFKKLKDNYRFLLIWLLISPIPAAITRDPYQVVRSTTMMIPYYLVVAYGLNTALLFLQSRWKNLTKVFVAIFCIGITILATRYIHNLFNVYPIKYSFAWQYGYKEAVDFISKEASNYDKIYFTKKYGEPHEFLLFYTAYDPNSYRNDKNLVRYERSNWFWVDSFSKYYFVNDWEIKDKVKCENTCLLITSPGNYPKESKVLRTINFLDNTPSFDIVEIHNAIF